MRILIIGGTVFLGRPLAEALPDDATKPANLSTELERELLEAWRS